MSKSTKVIIIGAPGIGKTSLLLRYCQDSFEKNYKSTIGVDFEVEKCMVLGQPLNLQLWDTAGAERFKGVTTNYFRGANAVVLVFDLSTFMFDETIEKTRDWLYEARENCSSDFELFLVGTKTDLVTNDRLDLIMPTIMEYALEYEAELWITSASTGYLIFLCDDKFDFSNFIYLLYREKCFRFI
jgi:small GTP-binding protein